MMDDAARGAPRDRHRGEDRALWRVPRWHRGGTLEELYYAYAKALGAPKLEAGQDRPAGYEETGGVLARHSRRGCERCEFHLPQPYPGMLEDAFTDVGTPVSGWMLRSWRRFSTTSDARRTPRSGSQSLPNSCSALQGLYDRYQGRAAEAPGAGEMTSSRP
jgi:hypothetical protein